MPKKKPAPAITTRRGRPPTDSSGPQKRRSVMLTDLEAGQISSKYGTLSGGVRAMFREIFAQETPQK